MCGGPPPVRDRNLTHTDRADATWFSALAPRRGTSEVERPGGDSTPDTDHHMLAAYRCTRAVPPLANASTSESVAMLTSPWYVVSSAPCAHPRRNASSGVLPFSNP